MNTKISLLLAATVALYSAIGCQQSVEQTGHGGSSTGGQSEGHMDSLRRQFHLDKLERVTLKAAGHDIPTWVMDTDPKKQEGMMWLVDKDVKDDEGMIFVFAKAAHQGFWMENTILPLDIIFISKDKKVLNIQHGKPYDQTNLPSAGDAMYVLEMKDGASKRLGIKPGTVITIPDTVKSK